VRVHAVATGPEDGTPVVFLHGVSGSMATYAWLPAQIADGRRIVRVDLRGHGRSGHAPGRYDVDDYGEDVVDLLREQVGRPAVLVGHSLGGVVAWWVAQRHPDLVVAAFLEDPPLYMGEPPEHERNGAVPIFRTVLDTVARWKAEGVSAEAATAQLDAAPFGPDRSRTAAEALCDGVSAALADALLHMDPGVVEIVRVAGAGHGIHNERDHRGEYVAALARFLATHT
jgi:esterase